MITCLSTDRVVPSCSTVAVKRSQSGCGLTTVIAQSVRHAVCDHALTLGEVPVVDLWFGWVEPAATGSR